MPTAVAGTAAVRFVGDFDGLNREIAKRANPLASQFGNQFGKALGPVMSQQKKHIERAWTGLKFGGLAAGAGAALALKDIVDAGSEFEKQMSVNAAVAEANGKQMARLEKQSLKLGQATFYSATQAAEAQGELIKGGLSVQQTLGGGTAAALALAEAGQLDLAEAAEVTANAMKLFDIQAKDSGKVADAYATAANRTTADVTDFASAMKQGGSAVKAAGGDFNEGLTILEALAETGIKNSDAGTSMKTALIQLSAPTKKQAALQKELNLSFFDQNGNLKKASGLAGEFTRVLKDKNGQERVSIAKTLAGTDGFRTLLALYDQGPKKLEALEKANEKQGTAQEVAAKKMDNFAGTWEQFKGSLETAEIQIYKGIKPALNDVAEEGERVANAVGEIFGDEHLSQSEKFQKALDFVGDELGDLWEKADIPEHAAEAFAAAAPVVGEAAAHTAVFAAEEFGKAFIHAPFIAKVAMGAWLVHFIGGKSAFVGIGKLYGKQFGLNFSREAEAQVAAAAPAVIAESRAIGAASAQAASAPAPPVAAKASRAAEIPTAATTPFLGAAAARKAAEVERQALYSADGLFGAAGLGIPDIEKEMSSRATVAGKTFTQKLSAGIRSGAPVVASEVASMGGRLVQGAATWGIGGYVTGQMVKEFGDSHTATAIGDALQGAGIGAAIGSVIPGVGTALGATAGGAGGALAALFNINSHEAQERGERYGEEFLKGWAKNAPRLEKMAQQGFIGTSVQKKRLPGAEPQKGGPTYGGFFQPESTGYSYRSGSGLRGELSKLKDRRENTKLNKGQLATIESQEEAIHRAIRSIKKDRADFRATLAQMSGDAIGGIGQINKDLTTGLSKADTAWGRGTKPWRKHTVEAMEGASAAIKEGIEAGVIDADAGQKRINALLRKIKLVSGKDPAGIAEGVAKSFKEADQITRPGVKNLIHDLDAMPKGAKIKGIESIEGMTQAWAKGHPKLEKQADLLTEHLESKFSGAAKAIEKSTRTSMNNAAGSVESAAGSVEGSLMTMGGDLVAALRALGATKVPHFNMRASESARAREAELNRQRGGPIPGTFMVPGTGTGDTFRTALPPGSFIENRNAARMPFQQGGLTPVALEPKERVWLPEAVKQVGAGYLHARNQQFSRFQKGGETGASLPHPFISGPEPLRGGAQHGVDQVWKGAVKYLRAHSMPPRIRAALHAAEAIIAPGFGYAYGGGHGGFAIQPVDCSGLDSYILHAAKFINSPMSVQQGSGLYTLGKAGPGKWLTWGVRGTSGANAHTMIALKALQNRWRFFESGGSAGGGGGAREVGGWDGNFQFRHMPGFQKGGQVGMPKKAQEAVAKFGQEAFNPKSEHFVGWGFQGGGSVPWFRFSSGGSVPSKKGELVGASTYGGPADNVSNPTYGAAGPSHPLAAQLSFAELAMGKALGGLKFGTPLTISRAGKSIVAYKEDIGLGGGDVDGHNRAIDLWYNAAQALGVVGSGSTAWLGTVRVSSADGTKGQNAKEEKEHTYKEDVPANYDRLPCGNKPNFHKPKNLPAVEREIDRWTKTLGRYHKAIGKARKEDRPHVVQELQHREAEIAHFLRELRNEKVKLRQQKAHKAFTKRIQRRFGKLLGKETAIEEAQHAYEKRNQYAGQVMDLEPLQPELPGEPEFPEQAKGESDTAYEKKRLDAHNEYERNREKAERGYVGGLTAYIGGPETSALQHVLESEAAWRNTILGAERFAAGQWENKAPLGGFEGRFEANVIQNVENQELIKAHIQQITDKIRRWQQSDQGKKWLKNHPGEGLPKGLEGERRLRERLTHIKLPNMKFKEGELRKTLGEARGFFYPGRAEYGRRGFDLKTNPPTPAIGSGSFEEALKDVQGYYWPGLHETIGTLPPFRRAGQFGGAIWETQGLIEELGLKITQANNSVQKAQEEKPAGGGSDQSEADKERLELVEEENRRLNQEKVGRRIEEAVLGHGLLLPPYVGKAHTGAIVPGAPNQERTMIVKGREGIFTQEQMAALAPAPATSAPEVTVRVHGDIHSDRRDPVDALLGDKRLDAKIEAVRDKRDRHSARRAGRGLVRARGTR